jgi:GDP-L-fucose synthase
MMQSKDSILVTGVPGLVGTNLVEHLRERGFTNVTGIGSRDCDLTDRQTTLAYFEKINPDFVFHLAGYVFGILGNMRNQAESYLRNTLINTHVVDACHKTKVKKVVAMGTVAMYPDPLPSDPLREDTMWMGAPHSSERGYAYAKRGMLAHLEVCHDSYGMKSACAISTNLYGEHDRFNIDTGHVLPTLVRKFYEARQAGTTVSVWGDGSAVRDFMYIRDAVRGLLWIMNNVDGPVNLATGKVRSIRDAADILAKCAGLEGKVTWDSNKPSGQVYRAYDIKILKSSDFNCVHSLEEGLRKTYQWYEKNHATARKL